MQRIDLFNGEDPNLTAEEFLDMVKNIVSQFNLLPQRWLKAPAKSTDDDMLLSFRLGKIRFLVKRGVVSITQLYCPTLGFSPLNI